MSVIAIDIETPLITPDCQHPPVVCLSVCDQHGIVDLYDSEDRYTLYEMLDEALGYPTIVGHHCSFDWICIALDFPELLPKIRKAYAELRIADTEERERLYSIARGYYKEEGSKKGEFGLAYLADYRLGMQLEGKADVRFDYGALLGRPLTEYTPAHVKYAKNDALATWKLYQNQDIRYRQKVDQRGYADDRIQARRQWCASWASHHGMGADPERVADFERRITTEYRALKPAMERHGIVRWKKGSYSKDTKKIQAMVLDAYGPDADITTDKGNIKTDELTLKESNHPLLMTIADYQHIAKMVNNDLVALKAAAETRQHPYYRLLSTGRVQGSKPNLMNVPTRWGVRDCYEPDPGHVYIDCDYSGLELRAWAQVCLWLLGYSRLGEFLNDDLDAHLEMARQLLNIPYEEAAERKGAKDPEVKLSRKVGKHANFGLQGGMGIPRFIELCLKQGGITLTEERAAEVKRVWKQTWPEADPYLKIVGQMVGGFGRTTTVEQYVSRRIRGQCDYSQCANTFFQGLAADGMIYAWWMIQEATMTPGDPLYDCRVVGVIHDQFLVEAPENRAHEAAMRLSELMCAGMATYIPDIKIKAEPVITRRWLKEADQVWRDGRLCPYEPEE